MDYILDGALILVIAVCVGLSIRKGFVSASKSILALILTAILLSSLQPMVLEALERTAVSERIRELVAENISAGYEKEELPEDTDTTDTENAKLICSSLGFPKFIEDSMKTTVSGMKDIRNNVMEVITDSLTLMILRVLSMLLVFLMVRIFVFLILKLLETLFEIPGLKAVNKGLGAILGIVNSLLLIYIVCGAVSFFAPTEKLIMIEEAVDKTYILKYFYENNILMSLFV